MSGKIFLLDSVVDFSTSGVNKEQSRLLLFNLTVDGRFPAQMVPSLSHKQKQVLGDSDTVPGRQGMTFFHEPQQQRRGPAVHSINARFKWGAVFRCGHACPDESGDK